MDETGNVANNVETEMLVQCGAHVVSYVIVRGSVPVYWTQPGYKYRPPPIIESSKFWSTLGSVYTQCESDNVVLPIVAQMMKTLRKLFKSISTCN